MSRDWLHVCTITLHTNDALQEGRHVIVAGDMNDYDGRIKDSYGHKPTSMVLKLMAEPANEPRLISAGEHVQSSDRFTDWYLSIALFSAMFSISRF